MKRPDLLRQALPVIAACAFAIPWLTPVRAQDAESTAPKAQPAADSPSLSDKEKALLQRINALKAPRWRQFGACRYDWTAWKVMPDGVRITAVQCGRVANEAEASESVAVHCDTLKLSTRSGDQPWSSWRLPLSAEESSSRGAEDRMVAALCANVQPIPKPQPPVPQAAPAQGKAPAQSAAKPAAAAAQKAAAAKR